MCGGSSPIRWFRWTRKAALADVGTEGSYAVPRFLSSVYAELSPGPLGHAALSQLVKLAQVGTAYESVPLILKAMVDPQVTQLSVGILDWAAQAMAAGGRTDVAGQATYTWSAESQKEGRAALERLTTDRNP